MILVDTDIFIDFFRGFEGSIRFIMNHKDDITFSAITEGELLSGKICDDFNEREHVFHLLSQFEKIPVDNPLIQVAGDIRRTYGLELPDAIIAASAIVRDSVLITRNTKDFEKIKDLKIQKPY